MTVALVLTSAMKHQNQHHPDGCFDLNQVTTEQLQHLEEMVGVYIEDQFNQLNLRVPSFCDIP